MPADDTGHVFSIENAVEVGSIAIPASPSHDKTRADFEKRTARRMKRRIRPFPVVTHPPLSKAIEAVQQAANVMLPLSLAHSIADEFNDPDVDERQDEWMAALRTYEDALSAILLVPAPSLPVAVQKIEAFFAGQGATLSADGEPQGPFIGEDPVPEAFASLWRDIKTLDAPVDVPWPDRLPRPTAS